MTASADSLACLDARINALELVVITHILQSGVADPMFEPRAFALSRRQAWCEIGNAVCDDCPEGSERQFAEAYAAAMARLGDLLISLAEPVQEAVDEVRDTIGSATSDAARAPADQGAPQTT